MASNPESILDSVKKVLGIDADVTDFDLDLILYINTTLGTLVSLGAGPLDGLFIEDNTTLWSAFSDQPKLLSLVKAYMALKVRLLFDPPATSFALDSMTQLAAEYEWRVNTTAESLPVFVPPTDGGGGDDGGDGGNTGGDGSTTTPLPTLISVYNGTDPTTLDSYHTTTTDDGSFGFVFTPGKQGTLKEIGYFSPNTGGLMGTADAVSLFVLNETTPIFHYTTPKWDGAAGSGWIRTPVPPTDLVSGTSYVAQVHLNQGEGKPVPAAYLFEGTTQLLPASSSDGNISVPAPIPGTGLAPEPYHNNADTYPDQIPSTPLNWLIDVGINFSGNTLDVQNQISGISGAVISYSTVSELNDTGNAGSMLMRVLTPTAPAAGVPHGFLWVLPVEPSTSTEQGSQYGDGIATMEALGIHNTYNLTCIELGFPVDPWYGDSATDPNTKQETYVMTQVKWASENLAVTDSDLHYLIGFSKSGFGGQVLFWKHQDIFKAVASWDAATDYATLAEYDGQPVFGDQNTLDSYKLFNPNLTTWKAQGNTGTVNRIWLGAGINLIQATADYDARLTADGILHTYSFVAADSHNWAPNPGWVAPAVAAMLGS